MTDTNIDKDEYNGWANRETWAVDLHINNDQGMQEAAHERVRQCLRNEREGLVGLVADALSDWVEEITDPDEGLMSAANIVSFLKDVGSLYRVDWRELAEHFIQAVREDDES